MISRSDKAAFLIVANAFKYAVGFLMPVALVRLLSQSDYGTYQQLILVGNTALSLMVIGLPVSIYYFYHQDSPERIPSLLGQTSVMLALVGMLAVGIIYVGARPLAALLNNPSMAGLLSVYALSVGFMIACEHVGPLIIAQNRYKLAVGLEITETCVRVLVLLAPLAYGLGLSGVVAGLVAFGIMRFAGRSLYLYWGSGLQFNKWQKTAFPREQLAYCLPLALVSLTGLIAGTINKGIVAASFSPAEFAIYSVGILEIPLDVIFQASVADVLRSTLPALVRDGNYREIARVIHEATRKLAIIVLPSFVFLFGYADEFVTSVFTPRYRESVQVFQIYVWLVPLHMFVLSFVPQIFGKPKINLYIAFLMSIITILLSFMLLKLMGLYGPALALVIATYLTVFIYVIVVIKLTKTSITLLFPVLAIFRIIVAALVGLVVARLLHAFGIQGALGFLLSALVFSITFLVGALLLKVFTARDIALIRRWLGKVVPRFGRK